MKVRCFLLRQGRVRGVEVIEARDEGHARHLAAALFREKGPSGSFDGYSLWDRARLLLSVPEAEADWAERELEAV